MSLVAESRAPKLSVLHRAVDAVVETIEAFSRAKAAAAHYEFLSNLSDEELAERGHARDTIAQHVANRFLQV